MPARIAFCITTLGDGGAERQLVELATRLPRDRFEPAVVVLSGPPQPPANVLVRILHQHAVSVTFLGARHVWQSPVISRRLVHWLRLRKPALLQCFLAHANVLGAYAGLRAGVRSIVTGIRVAEQRHNWHIWLQRQAARFVDKHVCVSRSVAEFAEHDMRLSREKLVVIPNGIDVERFAKAEAARPEELGLAPHRRIIVSVGRLDPQKRPDWLIDRMPAVAARLPEHDLVIVGQGPLLEPLRRRANRLGVADRVRFVGWRPDVPRLLAAADLVVLTSAWEGMPNAVLEAMAAARPVIATEVHGVAELVGDDAGGQVTPANDAAAFVDAVVRIAGDPNLAVRLGERNRRRAASEFSIDQTVRSYAELYGSLLGRIEPPKPAADR